MKNTALLTMLVIITTGCATRPLTRLECGIFNLAVSGSVKMNKDVSAVNPQPGTYLCLDAAPQQVFIEAKFVELTNRDLSILGINWLTEDGILIDPASTRNTTPPPPSIGFGFGLGFGSGGGGGRNCERSSGGHNSRGGSGIGAGMGFNIPLSSSNQITSIIAQFELEAILDLDSTYLVLQIQEKVANDKILVRPVIVPVEVRPMPKPKDEPIPVPPTATVIVKDGKTIDISGLKMTETEVKSKIPLLGDIPKLGRLFKNKGGNVQRPELLIFVTPRIIITEEE